MAPALGGGVLGLDPRRLAPPLLLVLLLAGGHLSLLAPPLRAVGVLALLVLLPGLAAVLALLPGRANGWSEKEAAGAERLALAAAAGFGLLIAVALLWAYTPARTSATPVLLGADALTLLGLAIALRRGATLAPWRVEPRLALALLGILAVAAWFRLADLGYSELQSDEVQVVLRGVALAQGNGNAIFLHRKAPAEILVATVMALLTGDASETTLRLPFALASLAGVLAVYALARRWLTPPAALLAALLFALNGFAVAFGRIVQYQSVVILLGTAGVLAWARATRGARPAPAWLALAALLLGGALLTHYDAAFVAPALLVLGVGAAARWRWRPAALAPLLLAGLGGIALAALFYLPYAHHPFALGTARYLAERRGSNLLYDNFGQIAIYTTVYNAVYYALVLGAGVVAGLGVVWPRLDGPAWMRRLLALAVAGAALLAGVLAARDDAQAPPLVLLVVAVLVALTLGLLRSRGLGASWKALWLWLLVPALLFGYFSARPGTHFYVLFPPLTLLAASGLAALSGGSPLGTRAHWQRGRGAARWWPGALRLVRRAGAVAVALLLVLSAAYLQVAFVSHQPEYRRTFPESRLALFPTLTDDLPRRDWFGFPYQAGWRAIGALYDQGVLAGPYASNEEPSIVRWYTHNAPACARPTSWIFLGQHVQDGVPLDHDLIDESRLAYTITIEGRPNLQVYRPADAPPALPTTIEATSLTPRFGAISGDWRFGSGVDDERPYVPERVEADLTPEIHLMGYRLRRASAAPGEVLDLTLYFEVRARPPRAYDLDILLGEAARWPSRDHRSACDTRRSTASWRAGEQITLRHVLPLPSTLAAGSYPLVLELHPGEPEAPALRQPLTTVAIAAGPLPGQGGQEAASPAPPRGGQG